jgi:hypothetical protein
VTFGKKGGTEYVVLREKHLVHANRLCVVPDPDSVAIGRRLGVKQHILLFLWKKGPGLGPTH